MRIEAKLDVQHFNLQDHGVGDKIGDCEGEITHVGDENGVVASVNPYTEVCQHCPLSEYCSESKAD